MASEPSAPESPTTESAAPGASASGGPRPEPRFFGWIRSLGLVRHDGWLGGVCAAVAERIRLDPILVRGIVVVLAVLGAPVVLLYAAAWLLLPDRDGRIHALELARGRIDRAIIGIAVLALLSLLPLTQGVWWAGAAYWGMPDLGGSAWRVVWTAVVIAAVVGVVIWLARRAGPDIQTVPATTDDKPETVPRPMEFAATPATVASPATDAPDASVPESAPERPPAGASDAELAAWRERQQAWREQRSAWAAQQRREDRERRAAAQAAWAEQRQARLAAYRKREPFIGGAYIGATLGLAIVVGGAAALAAVLVNPAHPIGWTVGFGAAVVVFGLALAIAGTARRRAGALAVFAILSLVVALATTPLALQRQFLAPGGYAFVDTTRDGSYARIGGGTTEMVVFDGARPSAAAVDLWQSGGVVVIRVAEDRSVHLVVSMPSRIIRTGHVRDNGDTSFDGRIAPSSTGGGIAHYDVHYGATGDPDATIVLRLTGAAGVQLLTDHRLSNVSTPSPSPTPTYSPGAQP
jgi:phage shock protein PspC (stress-responsive transcriptional regulator)